MKRNGLKHGELEKELATDAYGREILSSSALLRLLVELGRSLQQTDSQKPEPVMPKNPRVLEMMRYIEEHLTEDLVEASKISSGNITLQIQKINLVELVYQTAGEFVWNMR